jgi:hypothetical protein
MPKETNAQLLAKVKAAQVPFYVKFRMVTLRVSKAELVRALGARLPEAAADVALVPFGYAYEVRAAK